MQASGHISRKLTQNIFQAFDFAKVCGMPINLFVVIHIHETDARAAATMFELIRHKYRDWLNYRARRMGFRLPPLYVFTFEAPGQPHVNWALRVPPVLMQEFLRKLPQWVAKVQGPVGKRDIHTSELKPGEAYKALADYIVKGCDPGFIEHFHLTKLYEKHGPQGQFWGRRAGVSPALNKTARDGVHYDPKRRRLTPPMTEMALTLPNAKKAA